MARGAWFDERENRYVVAARTFNHIRANALNRLAGLVPRSWAQDKLLHNMGWYGVAEITARLSRLVTTVILARMLTPVDLGIAAMALACFELIRVLSNNGIGQMVMRVRPERLDAMCATAYWAGWIVCLSLALLQVVVGAGVAYVSGRPELLPMIACLAGVYLLMPQGLVQCSLLLRANRVRPFAAIVTVQLVLDNLLTAVLAIAGFGAWAVVLPKLLTAPLWLIGMRRAQSWRRNTAAGFMPMAEVWRFAGPVFGSELLNALRMNADKFLVGGIVGVEALGLYYFAFNAGIGFSLSLISALSASIYPHLAEVAAQPIEMLRRFQQALWRTVAPIGALIGCQALAAFVYVPWVFGQRWQSAVPLVAMLCASAITRPAFEASAQLLRAAGLPAFELTGSLVFSCLYLGLFAAFLPLGLTAGIAALAVSAFVLQALFAVWARGVVARQLQSAPDRVAASGGLYATAMQG